MVSKSVPGTKYTPKEWWWSKRYSYNKGLIISGFIAFLLYCILGPIIIGPHEEFEETIFDMGFQGSAYFVAIIIANVFYTLGWLIDISFNKNNSTRFRERLFALGYWFSFSLPILLTLSVMARFLIWGK
ncbi:MAG: hypothetical protein JST32_06355 [Bacteroidetes bacterium]|nr:hypothetical protein [Bacteroidota bacterium]